MKKIIKQAIGFIGISGLGWIIDIIIYTLLTSILKINVNIANAFSSFIGVSFVFIISTRKLFINNSRINIKIKYIIYIVYQIILISSASYIMLVLKNYFLEVIDIKYCVAVSCFSEEQIYCFSALVMYKNKNIDN